MASRSSQRRHKLKEQNPEKYMEELVYQNAKYHVARKERLEYWATGTRPALADKAAYYAKRRMIDYKARQKQKAEKNGKIRATRSRSKTLANPPVRVNRKDMTPEERRDHDNARRRAARARKSRQKRCAEKAAAAKYMKEYRLRKKLEKEKSKDANRLKKKLEKEKKEKSKDTNRLKKQLEKEKKKKSKATKSKPSSSNASS